jgi:hypothetical protein
MRFTKRSHCVDADLARLYGVPTKRLNEQVNRSLTTAKPSCDAGLGGISTAELVLCLRNNYTT